MKFYRYFKSEDALKTLSGLCLRFSDPRNCNDPFEFRPIVDLTNITTDEVYSYYHSEEELKNIRFQSDGLKEKNSRDASSQYVKSWFLKRNTISKNINFQESFCKSFHILYGSKNCSSILMWSHYAENHKGVVIEFNLKKFPFSVLQEHEMIIDVNYDYKRPVYYHSLVFKDFRDSLRKVIDKKFKCWDYEEEVRIILPVGDEIIKGGVFKKPDNHYYLPIPPDSISSVIMGERIGDADFEKLQKLFRQEGFTHIELKRIFLSENKFELEIE